MYLGTDEAAVVKIGKTAVLNLEVGVGVAGAVTDATVIGLNLAVVDDDVDDDGTADDDSGEGRLPEENVRREPEDSGNGASAWNCLGCRGIPYGPLTGSL